jgi:hypothetical protein
MSDLEFQRALGPDQMREALSLLDSTAGLKIQNLQVGDLSPTEEVDPGVDQASTTRATQDQPPAVEDPQQHTKHRNLVVVALCGLGIAAAATLTLLSWSDRVLTPPPLPGIAHEQLPNQPAAQLVKSASPALPVANPPPDQSPGGSERWPSKPAVADSSPVGHANRDDDQAAVKDAANSASAIPQTATVTAIATRQAWWDERASRKPKEVWSHTSAVRVAAAKKRYWRRHWQPLAEINGGECFLAACPPWQKHRAFYEPPRTVTQ